MLDWMARTLELPKKFLSDGEGGGVIQVRRPPRQRRLGAPALDAVLT